jgi:ABC-type sugar transport system ATPase subunit
MVELQLQNIAKVFTPSITALDDVSLIVAPGECLVLVGPSGCGKTTLLRVIAGLETPTSGRVLIDGRCVNEVPCHERGVALFMQRPALIPQQTVRHNLRWAWTLRRPTALLFGITRQQDDDLLRVASILGLDGVLDRRVGELSGGQQQRVALGRCLLREAPLWLLDEPLGHLDAPLRTELRRQVRALVKENRVTAIHVTHDPEEAFAVGDRVAVMQAGQIVQVDAPAALRRAPSSRYVAELVHHQSGGMNFLTGAVIRAAMDTFLDTPFGRWPISVERVDAMRQALCEGENFHPGEGKAHVVLGVAVEDVRCSTAGADDGDTVQITLPVQELESSDEGTCVIGVGPGGRWVGRACLDEPLERGQAVTMTFSLARAYWFDVKTGRTLALPTE